MRGRSCVIVCVCLPEAGHREYLWSPGTRQDSVALPDARHCGSLEVKDRAHDAGCVSRTSCSGDPRLAAGQNEGSGCAVPDAKPYATSRASVEVAGMDVNHDADDIVLDELEGETDHMYLVGLNPCAKKTTRIIRVHRHIRKWDKERSIGRKPGSHRTVQGGLASSRTLMASLSFGADRLPETSARRAAGGDPFAATPPWDMLKSLLALTFKEDLKVMVVHPLKARLNGAVKPEDGKHRAQAPEERRSSVSVGA